MNTETKVGMLVIVCVALLGLTFYYVGNEQWGSHVTAYKTYLRYAGGVGPGAQVLFGGIEVGRVKAVRAWSEDPSRIEILFEVKEGTPLNEKSVAKLGSVSLMSSPAISITTGAQSAPKLKPGQVVTSQETVSLDDMTRKLSGIADSAEDLIGQVQGELKGISGRAETLLTNLNEVTGPTNRNQIAEILRQVNQLVATQAPKIDHITDQVASITQNADTVINKVGPLVDHTDATVLNVDHTIDELRDPIRQDLAQLQSTMEQAKSLIGSLQTVVRSNDDNIQETIENLRVATENLDELTDQVKQRPWSLVRIRQPKDRKVPQ
ncbi:MAG: MCE family protein [Bryobacterales bacterium]|nr:MCE family protein [Bryobacterales bacterium]